MPLAVETWAGQICAGDVRAIARAITAIEDHDPHAEELLRQIFPSTGSAHVVGVTGAPGTGKSTLVDSLAAHYRRAGEQVGIIAVDPTSPYSGGAILGDRIRMQGHASDSGIFIRSMATRGCLGGLARATGDVALILDASGKQHVLVETVGVGQDEVDIVRLADCTLVLLVPGMGDDVQNMKAGLMEIEAPGAGRDGWKPKTVRTVATENTGVDELAAAIAEYREHFDKASGRQAKKREHWKRRLVTLAEELFLERALAGTEGEAALDALAREVADRREDPYSAVHELLSRAGISWNTQTKAGTNE